MCYVTRICIYRKIKKKICNDIKSELSKLANKYMLRVDNSNNACIVTHCTYKFLLLSKIYTYIHD